MFDTFFDTINEKLELFRLSIRFLGDLSHLTWSTYWWYWTENNGQKWNENQMTERKFDGFILQHFEWVVNFFLHNKKIWTSYKNMSLIIWPKWKTFRLILSLCAEPFRIVAAIVVCSHKLSLHNYMGAIFLRAICGFFFSQFQIRDVGREFNGIEL